MPRQRVQQAAGIKSGASLTAAIQSLRAGKRVQVRGQKPQMLKLA